MIDTHAHIDGDLFDEDRSEMLERAFASGVESIIMPGIKSDGFDKLINLAESYNRLYFGIGIHPHHATEVNNRSLETIDKISYHNKAVAIGEIGLDYYYDFAPKDVQQKVFAEQIDIAKRRNMPVIIHNREADEDVLSILRDKQDGSLNGVLHCFSSPVETMSAALDLGFYISFTGNITFKKSTLGDAVESVPLDRLLLETDSPYMTPVPYRGKRNEPSFVRLIAEKISLIKSIPIEKVVSMTTMNAKKLFNILAFMIVLFLSYYSLYSQGSENAGSAVEEEAALDDENRYAKFIGINPTVAFNTIVETQFFKDLNNNDSTQSITYEGIIAYGGSIMYSPVDFCVTEIAFLYSKNTKVVDEYIRTGGTGAYKPSEYYFIELSSHWSPNPYGRVNIYGTLGLTGVYSTTNFEETSQLGFNFGVGFYINIPTNFGLFTPTLEWRIDYLFGKSQGKISSGNIGNPDYKLYNIQREVYFSLPRFGIVFYPKF
ncbi:MAG: TatD family deoxyribonuclease [Bacteroidota bacterium]|nr:TatD family deoxyribonuclease [Bacteroidota bacterium]